MSLAATATPQFERPPVVELALSVQFKPLFTLSIAHLGLLWERWRLDFPEVEPHPPLPRIIETYEDDFTGSLDRLSLELVSALPFPRLWLLTEDGAQLLQVQQDRVVQNWRRRGDHEYPSYTNLRDDFRERLNQFSQFLSDEKIGACEIDQCEITYVDHVAVGEGGRPNAGDLGQVFQFWQQNYADPRLGVPEQARCNLSFVMRNDAGEPVGRIHLNAQPAVSRLDNRKVLEVQTTGRGSPLNAGLDGAMKFLDLAHAAVVQLFLATFRPELQMTWRPNA